jgi:hypothetical protein
MAPEGRESVLIYSRASKKWISTATGPLSLDTFLEGITVSHNRLEVESHQAHWLCCSYYCEKLCLWSYHCVKFIKWKHNGVMTFHPLTCSSPKLLVSFWYNFAFCKAMNIKNMVLWEVMPCSGRWVLKYQKNLLSPTLTCRQQQHDLWNNGAHQPKTWHQIPQNCNTFQHIATSKWCHHTKTRSTLAKNNCETMNIIYYQHIIGILSPSARYCSKSKGTGIKWIMTFYEVVLLKY